MSKPLMLREMKTTTMCSMCLRYGLQATKEVTLSRVVKEYAFRRAI